MEIKRFLADDVREGMLSVRSLLGPDAVIISNRRVGQKIEILATNQFDAESLDVSQAAKRKPTVEVSDFGRSSISSSGRSEDPRAITASAADPAFGQGADAQGLRSSEQGQPQAVTSGQIAPLGGQSLTQPRQTGAVPKLHQITSLGTDAVNDLQEELGSIKKLLVGELSKLRAERRGDQGRVAEARLQLMDLGFNAGSLDEVLATFDAEAYQSQDSEAEQWRYLLGLLGE
ncbi:MAG: hypothetical protein CBD42_007115, partial [Gammaproteobacteria bacterium TMED182]